MITRCPGCATTFRVTSEQLKARQGRVRCGQCQQVFNAIEHLTDVRVEAPAADIAPQDDTIVIELSPTVGETVTITDASIEADAPEIEVPAVHSIAASPEMEVQFVEDIQPDDAREDDAPILQPSPLSDSYASPGHIADDAPRWPWAVAALLALLVLTAQALIAFRVDLAAKHPGMKPLLTTLCQVANCTIGLPGNPDLVSIEASDLHPGRKNGLELTATLRNHAAYAQAWPNLELTLTDATDKPIVRKVLTPVQYLPASQSAAQLVGAGFAANSDIALQLALDPDTLPADGYRLYLFYP